MSLAKAFGERNILIYIITVSSLDKLPSFRVPLYWVALSLAERSDKMQVNLFDHV